MNEICAVDWCDRPVVEGHVCSHCSGRLERALGDVPALWEELDTVLTKQARYAAAEARRGERSLPFNPEASEIGWVLRNTLSTWCRLIAEERGRVLPDTDTPPAVAKWLLGSVEWLRHHRAGAEAVEEITTAVNAVRKVADRPAPKIYAGPCPDCQKDMYGPLGAQAVECRPCGLSYTVSEMLQWMHAQMRGKLVTAREATVLLGRMQLPVAQKTIDKWWERKRIPDHGHDPEGKRLYLFDDLVTLAAGSVPAERAS